MRQFSPAQGLVIRLFIGAWLLLVLGFLGLSRPSEDRLRVETHGWEREIAQDLAAQIGRAWSARDDLAVLEAMNASRRLHPDLGQIWITDAAGKIRFHTNPAWLGKYSDPVPFPWPATIEWSLKKHSRRTWASFLIPPIGSETLFLHLEFDETRLHAGRISFWIRIFILSGLLALGLALIFSRWLSGYDLIRSREHAAPVSQGPGLPADSFSRLLENHPQACFLLDRNNHLLAMSRAMRTRFPDWKEDWLGQHWLRLPWPADFGEILSQGLAKAPKPAVLPCPLDPQSRHHTLRLEFSPAAYTWQLVLVSWI